MRSIEIDLRKHWSNIWIEPPSKFLPCDEQGFPEHHSTRAFFDQRTADEFYMQDHGNSWSTYTWRTLPHRAVPFSQTKPAGHAGLTKNAPLSTWVLFDLDNGSPWAKKGFAWVFLFKSRDEAREYRKILNEVRKLQPGKIEVTAPVQYFQQPRKAS